MTGSIWRSMLLLAVITAALPAWASAQGSADLAAQSELTVKANADATRALEVVNGSKAKATRHLASARRNIQRAYRLTQRVNTKAAKAGDVPSAATVTARFTASVDENNELLETLVQHSSGRVEAIGAQNMAKNVAMRSKALLSSLRSYERADESVDPVEWNFDGEIFAHAEAFADISELVDADGVGERARARLEQGLANVLDMQTRLGERFVELFERSSESGRRSLAEIGAQLVAKTREMRERIEQSGHADSSVESSQGETTLGTLALSVDMEVRSDIEGSSAIEAHGNAQGTGTITLPSLP